MQAQFCFVCYSSATSKVWCHAKAKIIATSILHLIRRPAKGSQVTAMTTEKS